MRISMVAFACVALLTACGEPNGDGNGASGEVVSDMTWGGDELEVEFVRCNSAPGEGGPEVVRSSGPALQFHVRYLSEEDNEINRVELIVGEESIAGDNEIYRAPQSEYGNITLEPGAAANGTILMEPENDLAEAANPDGRELEFELRCGD